MNDTKKKRGRPKLDSPSYHTVHYRVRRLYGKASSHLCISCLGPADQWAYVGDDDDPDRMTETTIRTDVRWPDWSKVSVHEYSTNLSLYAPVCAQCHNDFDTKKDCGHPEDRRLNRPYLAKQPNGTEREKTRHSCRDCEVERSKARRKQALIDAGHPAFRSGV